MPVYVLYIINFENVMEDVVKWFLNFSSHVCDLLTKKRTHYVPSHRFSMRIKTAEVSPSCILLFAFCLLSLFYQSKMVIALSLLPFSSLQQFFVFAKSQGMFQQSQIFNIVSNRTKQSLLTQQETCFSANHILWMSFRCFH